MNKFQKLYQLNNNMMIKIINLIKYKHKLNSFYKTEVHMVFHKIKMQALLSQVLTTI